MSFDHINRVTGRNNTGQLVTAPLAGTDFDPHKQSKKSQKKLTKDKKPKDKKLEDVNDNNTHDINDIEDPHAFLGLQAISIGLYISTLNFESLTLLSGFGTLAIIIGVWAMFYIRFMKAITKIATSLIYGLIAYRISLFTLPKISTTGETFTIKYLATDIPITTSPWIYGLCAFIVLITLMMQGTLKKSQP